MLTMGNSKMHILGPKGQNGPKNGRATPVRDLFSAVDPKPFELQGWFFFWNVALNELLNKGQLHEFVKSIDF